MSDEDGSVEDGGVEDGGVEDGAGIFECVNCYATFTTKIDLEIHSNNAHFKFRVVCIKCGNRFETSSSHDQHKIEWILWEKKEVLCLHAELCMWADAVVIAPLSVHALGKFAGGYCDTLLTSVVRAWNCAKKPLFVVSCMDPLWKENYITLRNYNHTGNSEARWGNA
ncbi:hypothetical protein HN51_009426 [Arachis hypogaea]